jgi:DNA-binding PadR family transcriptional regulator
MPVPQLTHLQFLVLDILGARERPGKYIREKLVEEGERKSLPAFYQMMSRLEDADLVEGSNHRVEVEGQPITERRYKITGGGRAAWQTTRDFYFERARAALEAKGGRANV